MATPATRPLASQKVITLVMTGASEGSRKPVSPARSPSLPPTARPSIGLVTLMSFPGATALASCSPLLCIWVRLHHAEQIAFGVLAVGEVADGGNRGLGHNQLATGAGDRRDCLIHRINAERVGGCRDIAFFHQTAVDARRVVRAGIYEPILGRAGPLFDLPAKGFFVKGGGALGVGCGNFKMYDARHGFSLLCLGDSSLKKVSV